LLPAGAPSDRVESSIALRGRRPGLLGTARDGLHEPLDGRDALTPHRGVHDVEDVGDLGVVVDRPRPSLGVFVAEGVVVELLRRPSGVAPGDADEVELELAD
jgi:hypothetical protein